MNIVNDLVPTTIGIGGIVVNVPAEILLLPAGGFCDWSSDPVRLEPVGLKQNGFMVALLYMTHARASQISGSSIGFDSANSLLSSKRLLPSQPSSEIVTIILVMNQDLILKPDILCR